MKTAIRRVPLLLALCALLLPFLAFGAEVRAAKEITIDSSQKIFDDFYIAGGTVRFEASAPADLLVIGGDVAIPGTTAGDLLSAGGKITEEGSVGDDARIVGGEITLRGPISDSLTAAGGQLRVESSVGGDLLVFGGQIRISGPIGGDVQIMGGEVYIDSKIEGSVHVRAQKITLGPNTAIAGDFSYTSSKEATIEEGASIAGATNFTRMASARSGVAAFLTLAAFASFLMLLVGALFFGLMLSRYSTSLLEDLYAKPVSSILMGLAVLILTPVICVILLLTVIGIPLGALGILLYIAGILIAHLFSPIIVGSLLFTWFGWSEQMAITWRSILFGVLVFVLLSIIPIVGGLIKFLLLLGALGSGARVTWGALKEWR